ncbi:MAG: F0F1 ATP synthase subunit alpha [Pseudomonadota bacterium]|nr:F0F1 ATP synthase subunit alpha [Pseudomonadota bacterium]MEC8977768.1 F0F1 ATP synthase subunit alpha [Pseudomonadota bacterium]
MNNQSLNTNEIASIIEEKIKSFQIERQQSHQGKIVSIKDGIVQIYGLESVVSGEMLDFGNNLFGMALNLEEDLTGAIVLGSTKGLQEGDIVTATTHILKVPTGEALLGRVVNALGHPIDNLGPIKATEHTAVEKIAPGVIWRESVDEALQTGIKAIDTMTPVGKGQRELIIGDRETGKTSIAIDAILNQKNTGVKCIYVAIGQKASSVAQIMQTLQDHDAMRYTTIVNASASETAALQYIAPYSGCSMGEYYRDTGQDALIIYDDLSKHAAAYRQISLLLRRPPGREAFPGDVFYLHSRLLERAAKVNAEYVSRATNGKIKGKTGSLTALPIVETQAGDVSSFVPTNVISITDGQIFLDTDLFNAGIRPAINSGLSVSRVGGAAQTKIIKKLGSIIRITLAQYRELEAFSQFAADLDTHTRSQLEQGKKITELLKQPVYQPLSIAEMACILMLSNAKILKDITAENITTFSKNLLEYINAHAKYFLDEINQKPEYSDAIQAKFDTILDQFYKIQS